MSTIAVNAITDASGGTTASINGYTPSASNMTGRNRIINGAMMIDQRNAGAAVTVTTAGGGFAVDRFPTFNQCDGGVTAQQISDAPSNFNNSLKVTITSADSSLDPVQYVEVRQSVEGFNVADLAWGTAAAKTVTLSFWVKSSLTGTFGGSFMNSSVDRAYPFSYTIDVSNTWEFKTITVSGDTTGTWEKTNGNGMFVILNLGAGSDFQGVANAWVATRKHTVSGAVSLVATSGATWQVTGVQLEVGSSASEFEHRQYGTELALCQRYYQKLTASGRHYTSDGAWGLQYPFKVTMRANPTYTDIGGGNYSLPATNQGVISGSNQEAGVQWSGSAGTYWAYARAAEFNSEL